MNSKPDTWKRVRSKKIADCRVFQVREDFCERETDGKHSTFFVIENPDWVNVIAITKQNEVVLIEQYRHGAEQITLEIPGGMIDENETPETAAKRELLEETGFDAKKIILLGKSQPNPAIQNNKMFHFLAVGCEKIKEAEFNEHESVVTKLVSLSEIENLISGGKITHSLVIAAFHFFGLNKGYES